MALKEISKLFLISQLMFIFTLISTAEQLQSELRSKRVFSILKNSKKWICNEEFLCIKTQEQNNLETILFESQKDCRLSCGQYGAIWPMPTGSCTLGHERVHFHPTKVNIKVFAPDQQSINFLNEANRIFKDNIMRECIQNCTKAKNDEITLHIKVNSSSLVLNLETDESYNLSVKTTANGTIAVIEAKTVFGARFGLETLSNLITGSKEHDDLLLVSSADIQDRPKFAYRGLMLDTSRNFFPVYYIQKTLDAMAASKFNVFHWHVVDEPSFPLEIPQVPEMTQYGAYSSDMIYSRDDVKNIIEYAFNRGIRVLIEIEGPAHAGAGWQWGTAKGLGDLAMCIEASHLHGKLNPVNDNVYVIMKKIYQYLAEVLHPEYTLHIGGDELLEKCFKDYKSIKSKPNDDLFKLWSDFYKRNLASFDEVMNTVTNTTKDVIIWDSTLTQSLEIEKYLPKERFIIQVWNDLKHEAKLRKKGYRIITANKHKWYLSHGFTSGESIYSWGTMYDYHIVQDPLTLGGEACMWTEHADKLSFESRVWPRAGAVAERLWSNPDTTYREAALRFNQYRERLIARGSQPAASYLYYCITNEDKCNKKYFVS